MQSGTHFYCSEMFCILFGQIRTVELRNSARFVQTGRFAVYLLSRSVQQTYAEIAQLHEISKVGSNPVRVAPLLSG